MRTGADDEVRVKRESGGTLFLAHARNATYHQHSNGVFLLTGAQRSILPEFPYSDVHLCSSDQSTAFFLKKKSGRRSIAGD
jgi:hypothetical protein